MNPSEDLATSLAGDGKNLPDLAYVGQLFAALDAAGSVDVPTVVNEDMADVVSGVTEIEVATQESDAMSTEAVDEGAPLVLPAQCLMRSAVEIKATLQACDQRADLQVDVSAVERIDAAFMQLLLALTKQRKAAGKAAVRFTGTSAALNEAAQVLGLIDHLSLSGMAA